MYPLMIERWDRMKFVTAFVSGSDSAEGPQYISQQGSCEMPLAVREIIQS